MVASAVAVVLLVGSSVPAQATVPGRDGKIAFTGRNNSAPASSSNQIYTVNADGSGQTQLTTTANNFMGSWSPDGTKITFVKADSNGDNVFVMNADGTGQTQLTTDGNDFTTPQWSPDGTRIAFNDLTNSCCASSPQVFVMNADGSNKTQLTTSAGGNANPSWSPDGREIAFVENAFSAPQVAVMNADGSGQTQLTTTGNNFAPLSWSPDGTKIAFDSNRNGSQQIFVMNADGTNQTELAGGVDPSWSPDATKIAFISGTICCGQLFTMNADGSDQTQLLGTTTINSVPAWQTVPSADLALSLGATPNTVGSRKPLTYTITVHNNGPSNANGVVVSDQLPSTVRFVSAKPTAGGSCVTPAPGSTGLVQCTLGFMPNNTSLVDQVVVNVVAKKTTISNTATVTSNTPDPNLVNNSATITTPVK